MRPLPFWWRITLGLACWALVLWLLFVLLVQPPKQAPDEFFHRPLAKIFIPSH